MTFDRDFPELVESESRLSTPLADSKMAEDNFCKVRPNRFIAESWLITSSWLMVESSVRSTRPDWTECPQIAG